MNNKSRTVLNYFTSANKRLYLLVFLLTLSSVSNAEFIDYNGAKFSLSLEEKNGFTYDFKYTADFTNWDSLNQDFANKKYIAAVNFKPNTGLVPTSFKLLSTTASGAWTTSLTNATAQGCSGGAESFTCSEVDPFSSAATTTKETFEWLFRLEYTQNLSEDAFAGAPIRAQFVNHEGKNAGLLSENTSITTTEIPEPGTVGLLGAGLLWLGLALRRRNKIQS